MGSGFHLITDAEQVRKPHPTQEMDDQLGKDTDEHADQQIRSQYADDGEAEQAELFPADVHGFGEFPGGCQPETGKYQQCRQRGQGNFMDQARKEQHEQGQKQSVKYLPRDFMETPEGLIFAVVDAQTEDGRVLGFLRYVPGQPKPRKLGTEAANAYLEAHAPHYLHHSQRLDAHLHGVPLADIRRHYQPRQRVSELLLRPPSDVLEEKALRCLQAFAGAGLDLACVGITGSLLIGAQRPASDLDWVIYGRERFFQARAMLREGMAHGIWQEPDEAAWRETYERRGCELSYAEYLRHERRKFNKAVFEGVKFDITLFAEDVLPAASPVRKMGPARLRARVTDAGHAYDYPARYRLDHAEVREALSFTQTYAGQAEAGESVEIAGFLERTNDGILRICVGSSREARGEFVRVIAAD